MDLAPEKVLFSEARSQAPYKCNPNRPPSPSPSSTRARPQPQVRRSLLVPGATTAPTVNWQCSGEGWPLYGGVRFAGRHCGDVLDKRSADKGSSPLRQALWPLYVGTGNLVTGGRSRWRPLRSFATLFFGRGSVGKGERSGDGVAAAEYAWDSGSAQLLPRT